MLSNICVTLFPIALRACSESKPRISVFLFLNTAYTMTKYLCILIGFKTVFILEIILKANYFPPCTKFAPCQSEREDWQIIILIDTVYMKDKTAM